MTAHPDVARLDLWTPVVPPVANTGARDIDVSMLGSLKEFPYRGEALAHLARNGIAVATGGGQEADYAVSSADYYRTLLRSKIVLNFSQLGARIVDADGNLVHGLKGRVLETLACGALLLESRNAVTARYFSDGRDYVSFGGLDDLTAKIKFYLTNETHRTAIAERGHATFQARYTASQFWTRLLEGAAPNR